MSDPYRPREMGTDSEMPWDSYIVSGGLLPLPWRAQRRRAMRSANLGRLGNGSWARANWSSSEGVGV